MQPGAEPLPQKQKKLARSLKPFANPPRVDLDVKGSGARRRQEVKGFLYSPLSPHVHAALARRALFWNKGLFPRIEAPGADKEGRRRASTLAEERLLAVLFMQHGRNSEVLALPTTQAEMTHPAPSAFGPAICFWARNRRRCLLRSRRKVAAAA